jgi:hypothetical protein
MCKDTGKKSSITHRYHPHTRSREFPAFVPSVAPLMASRQQRHGEPQNGNDHSTPPLPCHTQPCPIYAATISPPPGTHINWSLPAARHASVTLALRPCKSSVVQTSEVHGNFQMAMVGLANCERARTRGWDRGGTEEASRMCSVPS